MIRNKKFNSFLGKTMYDHVVPKNHFLRKINEIVNWIPLVQKITPCYKGEFQMGASAISPVTLLKMLMLSYLYNITERQIEIMCNENITFKYFIEIAIDEKAPDHTTISKFRTRIINYYKDEQIFEKLFQDVLLQIMGTDIKIGNIQIIDSKHINARVSKHRSTKHHDDEDDNQKKRKLKQDIDPDASSGSKGFENKKDAYGNTVKMSKWFFGYKGHCSIENENDLITSCILSTGSASDGKYFEPLLWKDMAIRGMPKIYSADKGYDWGDHHFLLNQLSMGDAIILNNYRLIDDARHAIWHTIHNSEAYKKGKKQRFKIERTFGEMVNNGGIHDCRYFGRVKTAFQLYMTAMAYNLKKAVKVLYGISPKQPAPTCAF